MEDYAKKIEELTRELEAAKKAQADAASKTADEQYEKIAESFDNFAKMKDNCFLYDSFAEKVGKIKGISDEDKERLIAENEAAMKEVFFPEMEECAQRMRALEGSGGEYGGICQYPGGTEYYVFL